MADYSIVVKDKDGNSLGEFTQWKDLRFSDRLNNYGECSFTVPVTASELSLLTALRRYEVFIYRDDTIIWSGEQVSRYGSLEANSTNRVTILCRTFFEMLNGRFTVPYIRFDATDQGEILKELVDLSQDPPGSDNDFGFTFDQYTTGVTRDREYANQNIMEAFMDMSNVIDGPDFYITPDKVINIVPFKGIDKSTQTILEWGINLKSVNIVEDFTSPANEEIMLGSGSGSTQMIVVSDDLPTQVVYKLRQQRSSAIDVEDPFILLAKGDALIRKYKQPLLSLDIKQLPNTYPEFGSIALGDSIRIKIDYGIYSINNRFRVYGYNIAIDDDKTESIGYLVGLI